MKKAQLKLNNFALAGALERYKSCYEIELSAKKMWRKEAKAAEKDVVRLHEQVTRQVDTLKELQARIYFLEARGQHPPQEPIITMPGGNNDT